MSRTHLLCWNCTWMPWCSLICLRDHMSWHTSYTMALKSKKIRDQQYIEWETEVPAVTFITLSDKSAVLSITNCLYWTELRLSLFWWNFQHFFTWCLRYVYTHDIWICLYSCFNHPSRLFSKDCFCTVSAQGTTWHTVVQQKGFTDFLEGNCKRLLCLLHERYHTQEVMAVFLLLWFYFFFWSTVTYNWLHA